MLPFIEATKLPFKEATLPFMEATLLSLKAARSRVRGPGQRRLEARGRRWTTCSCSGGLSRCAPLPNQLQSPAGLVHFARGARSSAFDFAVVRGVRSGVWGILRLRNQRRKRLSPYSLYRECA